MDKILENTVKKLNLDKSKWKLVKFGDVAIQQKGTVDRENTELTKYILGGHMNSEDLHIRDWGNLTDEYLGPAFIRKFEKGDILYGSRRTYLRKVAIADFDGITSNTTFVMKADENKIDKRLLPFIMMSEGFTENSIKNSKGSVNPYINWKDIAKYEFLLPPREVQTKLADLLWAFDEVIENDKKVLENLEITYVTTIEKKIIDKNSPKVYFKDLGKMIRGVGYKPEDLLENYSENSFILLRSNNISDSKVNYEKIYFLPLEILKKDQLLIPGDFALCMSNGSKDLVGKAAKFEGFEKSVSIGSFCAGFRPKNTLSGEIINHLFASESYRQAISRILSGSAINNLKPSDIEDLYLRLNFESIDFKSIIISLNSLVSSKFQLESKIKSSKALQKSLINQVF
jgi:type I restriction enzyme S subunit